MVEAASDAVGPVGLELAREWVDKGVGKGKHEWAGADCATADGSCLAGIDVPDRAIVLGNPARVVGKVKDEEIM